MDDPLFLGDLPGAAGGPPSLPLTAGDGAVHAGETVPVNLEMVLASVSDAILMLDHAWRYVYLNDHAVAIAGRPRRELLGRCAWDLFPDVVGTPLYDHLQAAAAGRHSYRFEYHQPGQDRWFDFRVYPASGGLTLFVAEITERKAAVEALRQTREHLELAIAAGRMFTWEWDLIRGTVVRYQDHHKILGVESSSPDAFFRMIHPDDRPRVNAATAALFSGQETHDLEFRIIRPDGRVRWLRDAASVRRGADGQPERVIGVSEDITPRKEAEEAIRESEHRFRVLAEALPQLVWTALPDGRKDYVSAQWVAYTGRPEAEQLGSGWLAALHPEDQEWVAARWEAAVEGREPYDLEYRIRGRDGGYRWFKTRGLPMRDTEGRVVKWFGTCTDIDDQKRALEHLSETDRRKDEFLAMLAHELRNPLAPILTATEILNQVGGQDERAWRQRNIITRQTRHLARLLDDLLDVSRIRWGQVELRLETVDLITVVGNAVESLRPYVEARGHRLDIRFPGDPSRADGAAAALPLQADPIRLEQVVSNLVSNAAKYTDPGGTIQVTLDREDGHAVLRVRDTGMGITPDLLPHVFDLFTQGERALDRSQGGLGIGLTLVHALVVMHGGQVEARSDGPGRGSEFTVCLPLTPSPPAAATGAPRPPARAEDAVVRRVLVVEDNPDAAETLVELVELWGHCVWAAHDGPSALRVARDCRPDVILLDIGMPGMDGYEVARRLRASADSTGAFLVALTGYGQDEDRRRAREAGFDRHLTKPVDPELLRVLISGAPGS